VRTRDYLNAIAEGLGGHVTGNPLGGGVKGEKMVF